jgi:signal transduction histidine kinase
VAAQARAQVRGALESAAEVGPGRAAVAVAVQETVGVHRGGHEFPMELRLARCESPSTGPMLSVFVRDLTAAKQLQIELQHAQKLEAVGRLAAGVAHEINTPIQYIGDNTRFLEGAVKSLLELLEQQRRALTEASISRKKQMELEGAAARADVEFLEQEVPQTVTEMLDGLKRVATIVRALLEFAHPDQAEMAEADVNRILAATLEVARTEYKYVAEVDVQLTPVPNVLCHSGDLSQVFLNLIVNAAHAVMDAPRPEGQKGRITVGTKAEGGQVVVVVRDDGCGIPEAVRGRVFEPFFSTKEAGRGTGQGLAIVKRIVEKHRGEIDFETEVGRGTTFYVRLPASDAGSKGPAV